MTQPATPLAGVKESRTQAGSASFLDRRQPLFEAGRKALRSSRLEIAPEFVTFSFSFPKFKVRTSMKRLRNAFLIVLTAATISSAWAEENEAVKKDMTQVSMVFVQDAEGR